ncbi:MAG: GNAT family N-acetyltransferase [Myxococcota bacterium]
MGLRVAEQHEQLRVVGQGRRGAEAGAGRGQGSSERSRICAPHAQSPSPDGERGTGPQTGERAWATAGCTRRRRGGTRTSSGSSGTRRTASSARLRALPVGADVPGDWWRIEDDGETVGYGWMDTVWGDAEVLVAVASAARGAGVGAFAMDRLAQEADQRGLRYLHNVIPSAHPDPEGLRAWLQRRGFAPAGEGGLLRRPVRGQPATA